MTNIKRYTYTGPTILAQVTNPNNDTLWLALAQTGSGLCTIKKVDGFSPDIIFYSFIKNVDTVNDMKLDNTFLYLAYGDATVFAESISLVNPLTSFYTASFPSGVVESPIACAVQGSDIWFLTPGLSGNYATMNRYTSTMVWLQTIVLNDVGFEVTNAIDVCVDSNNELEIITNTSPSRFIRFYDTGGNVYAYTITETI